MEPPIKDPSRTQSTADLGCVGFSCYAMDVSVGWLVQCSLSQDPLPKNDFKLVYNITAGVE